MESYSTYNALRDHITRADTPALTRAARALPADSDFVPVCLRIDEGSPMPAAAALAQAGAPTRYDFILVPSVVGLSPEKVTELIHHCAPLVQAHSLILVGLPLRTMIPNPDLDEEGDEEIDEEEDPEEVDQWLYALADELVMFWEVTELDGSAVFEHALPGVVRFALISPAAPRYVNIHIPSFTVERSQKWQPLLFDTDHLWHPQIVRMLLKQHIGYQLVTVRHEGRPLLQIPHYDHGMLAAVPSLSSFFGYVSTSSRWQWFSRSVSDMLRGLEVLHDWRAAQPGIAPFDIDTSCNEVYGTHFIASKNFLPHPDLLAVYGTTPYLYANYDAPCVLPAKNDDEFLVGWSSKKRWKFRDAAQRRAPLGLRYGTPLSYEAFMESEQARRLFIEWFNQFEEPYPPIPNYWFDFNFAMICETLRLGTARDVLMLPVYDGNLRLWGLDFLVRLTKGELWERCWFVHDLHTDKSTFPGWFFQHQTALILDSFGIRALSCGPEDGSDAHFESFEDTEGYYKYQQTRHRIPTLGCNTFTDFGLPEGKIPDLSPFNSELVLR